MTNIAALSRENFQPAKQSIRRPIVPDFQASWLLYFPARMQHVHSATGSAARRQPHLRQARLRFRRLRRGSADSGIGTKLLGVLAIIPLMFVVALSTTLIAANAAMPTVAAAFGELPST